MSFDVDSVIFVGFLLVNLIVGLWCSRGIKTIREYTVGNRDFSTATIAATIVASWVSGNSIGMASFDSHSIGVFFLIPGLADVISLLIIGYIIAPRIGEFLGSISVADAMGILYGREVRVISAISGIMPSIGNVAIQFVILAALLGYVLDISSFHAVLISSFVIISYSTFGGIKAITFTDMIQFFAFGVIVPIITFLIWKSITDTESIFEMLTTNPIFDYTMILDYKHPNFGTSLLMFLFFLIPGLDPAIFQRISMAKNTIQVSKSFFIAGFAVFCLYVMFWLMGILILSNDNDLQMLDNFIQPSNLISYILDNYIHNGLKGMFVIGIMAMMMSSADSYINSASVLFAHDLCKSLKINLTTKKELLLARCSAFLIGIFALLLSLFSTNLLDLILSTYSFYMPIVTVPLLLAIFGFRSSKKSVLIGMSAGFITVIFMKLLSDSDSLILGMVTNFLFFIGTHYLLRQSGGWVGIKDNKPLEKIRLERKTKIKCFIYLIKNFSFLRFCKNNAIKDEKIFVYFGLFCMTTIFSNAYSLPKFLQEQYTTILNILYYSILTLSTIFITYPFWSKKFKHEICISILWNIAVFYNLIFCNSLLTIIGHFNQIQVTVLMASLITVAILMRWQIAILMIVCGVLASIQFYKLYNEIHYLPSYTNDLQFKVTYSLLLVIAMLIAFFKPKQEYQKATEAKVGTLKTEVNDLGEKVIHYSERVSDQEKEIERLGATAQKILNNVNHELRLPIGNAMNFAKMLNNGLGKLNEQELRTLSDAMYQNSNRLASMILNMLDLATLDTKKLELNKKTTNLSKLVKDRVNNCRKIYLEDKNIDFEMGIHSKIFVSVDPNYIKQVIDNLVINAIKFSQKGKIIVKLFKQNNLVKFSITDNGIGIPKEEIYDVFTPFKMGSNTESKAEGRGVGLALCKAAIEAHQGSITAQSDGKHGATFTFTLKEKF